MDTESIHGTTGQYGRSPGRRSAYERCVKPAYDRVAAALLLLLAAPVLGAIAVAVRLTMGRPVIFRQRRVGRGGRQFTCYKFRTMAPDRRRADYGSPEVADRRHTHKSAADPRITPVGRFLRATSLDELPQLVNVLRGDMSLVGPRPELPSIVAGYEPWQHRRHDVKPGMTGLWQVSARGDAMMHEATHVDIEYVEAIGFRADVAILARTVPALLSRPGH